MPFLNKNQQVFYKFRHKSFDTRTFGIVSSKAISSPRQLVSISLDTHQMKLEIPERLR